MLGNFQLKYTKKVQKIISYTEVSSVRVYIYIYIYMYAYIYILYVNLHIKIEISTSAAHMEYLRKKIL